MTIDHQKDVAAKCNLTRRQSAVTQESGNEAVFENESPVDGKGHRPTAVVVGSGFAGFTAARRLERLLDEDQADLVLISDTDHMNYSSLLPQVASGRVDPRHNAVALHRALHRTRIVLGEVVDIDVRTKTVSVLHQNKRRQSYLWDRLLLTPGSVARPVGDAGINRNSVAFHSLAQAVYLRDHLL